MHHPCYSGRLTRRASLARSLTAHSAAGLLLTLTTLPVITSAQGNPQSVTYRVTFEGKFTASALASGVSVPSGAHFTTLIGAVHNGSVTFWSDGGTASAGIESMAEVGGTSALKSEINAAGSNALAVIEQSIASGGTATATVDITLTADHPLVTLTSMVAPSPDWFVGVSGLSLRNNADDGWQPTLTVNLFPWDAGTPDGVTDSTAVWQWERSTGRNSWAVIDGADAASYTPVAADANTFLRVTATYDDEHGTGKTVSEVAPNVVTGPLLTGLTAETGNSQADTERGLYPAFDAQTLHYGIGCNSTDTMVLTVSPAANARVAVDGVQAAGAPEVVSVAVTADSDVAIRVTEASGAVTTYVVHCLRDVFFEIETHTFPNTDAFEDLLLFNLENYFRLMDRNGVPRLHLCFFPGGRSWAYA